MPLDLSVIIVNWNARSDLAACLDSLRPSRQLLDLEVVVVDNGSRDGSGAMVRRRFPWVRLLATGRNLGFARGNNVGFKATTGRYRLLLNPDTLIHGDALKQLVAYADTHGEVGLLGPRLLNADGTLQASCRRFPSLAAMAFRNTLLDRLWPDNPFSRGYLMADWSHDQARDVDWLSGACLLARQELLTQIGGLDERFFMYVEDVDWCKRVWDAGWKVRYLPSAVVTHLIGKSSDQQPRNMTIAHHRSMLRYVRRHHGLPAAALASPLISLRCALMLRPFGHRP